MKHTTSKELALELKKNGYPQKGIFCWSVTHEEVHLVDNDSSVDKAFFESSLKFVLPLASEIGEQLPRGLVSGRYMTTVRKNDFECFVDRRVPKEERLTETITGANNEADARAKMYIFLVKNGYITHR